MKKLATIALLGAFLAATNIGCGDSKPTPPKDKPAESGKDGPAGRGAPPKP